MIDSYYSSDPLYRERELKARRRKRKFVGYEIYVYYQSTESSSIQTSREKRFTSVREMRQFGDRVWSASERDIRNEWDVWDFYPENTTFYEYTADGRVFEVDFIDEDRAIEKGLHLAETFPDTGVMPDPEPEDELEGIKIGIPGLAEVLKRHSQFFRKRASKSRTFPARDSSDT